MHKETLRYEADGITMVSELYVGEGDGPRPGILVFPEAGGLGDHAKSQAERLAGLGYVALACDFYGDGRTFEGMEEIMAQLVPMRDPARTRARSGGGLAALIARPEVDPKRVVSIGYCFGGTVSLELARGGADIAAVACIHSGLNTASPAEANVIKAKILVCLGADDPGIPPEQRAKFEQEMRASGADWQMHLYGGVLHGFTNPHAAKLGRPDFARYDATADARSWTSALALFDEVIGRP
jgi:dienelactone hydrolase